MYLTGQGEIEASDGSIRPLEPGTILLAEETTGKGHKNRVTGTEDGTGCDRHTSRRDGKRITALKRSVPSHVLARR